MNTKTRFERTIEAGRARHSVRAVPGPADDGARGVTRPTFKLWFLVSLLTSALCLPAFAQGTAFTYQGRLNDGGNAYIGNAEFQATLWDAVSGGSQIAANAPAQIVVGVTNGLFVLPLDFGANFPGANRWLQLEVRTIIGSLTPLTPRQPLTPTPYAITASNLSGTLPAAQLSGAVASANLAGAYSSVLTLNNAANSFSGSGAGLTALNASELASGTVPDARLAGNVARTNQVWLLGGNAGTTPGTHFLGTRDEQPLEFKVNGARALRLEFHTNHLDVGSPGPNVISGHADNEVAPGVSGATIAGGGGTNWWGPTSPQRVSGEFSTIGGGIGNVVHAPVAVIAGGERGFIGTNAYNSFIGAGAWNSIEGGDATLSGGRNNTNLSYAGSISGGVQNNVSGTYAAIGGGAYNLASGSQSTVGGGTGNAASANSATVPGGEQNTASGSRSFAAGNRAKAIHTGAFVWADSQNADFASTANNQFSVRAAGGIRLAGDVQLETSTYRHLSLAGGNSLGYLYGSFPALADGVHLAYNHYYNAAGSSQVINAGGATSRLTVGYGFVGLYVGGVNAAPTTQRLLANSSGVTVNGTFNNSSDRNAKQDFAPVSSSQILEKISQLPIAEWSYKEDPATRHIGPMAQDFHSVFNIGTDDRHIAPLDEGGVALAAIQGLNQKLDETRADVKRRDVEIAELKRALEKLKQVVDNLPSTQNRP